MPDLYRSRCLKQVCTINVGGHDGFKSMGVGKLLKKIEKEILEFILSLLSPQIVWAAATSSQFAEAAVHPGH